MTRRGDLRDALRTALPLVLAMGANAINQFADRVFLARHSDAAIQASLPGGILSWLFICLLVAIAGYSGVFAAQFHGAGSRRDAAAAYGQGLWLTVVSVPLMLLAIPAGHWLFALAGHAPAIVAEESAYYDILMYGGVFCVWSAVLAGYFTGVGRVRLVGVATVLGNGANLVLDWMFIFGKCGCGAWGIRGAGWATVIAAAVPCVVLGGVTFFDPALRGLRYLAALRPHPKLLLRIVRYGVPSGLHQFVDVATFTVFVMCTGRFDAMSFAVSNICFAVNHLSFAPLLGLGQAASVLTGRYQGAGDSDASARATCSCLFLALAFVGAFALVVLAFPGAVMGLFQGDASAFEPAAFRRLGRILLVLLVSWAGFDAVSLVVGGALKGAGDTKFVMWALAAISLGLWMPVVWGVMAFRPDVVVLWGTMPFYCCICATTCLVRFIRGRWRTIRLVADLRRADG